jgi:hypothetical protein
MAIRIEKTSPQTAYPVENGLAQNKKRVGLSFNIIDEKWVKRKGKMVKMPLLFYIGGKKSRPAAARRAGEGKNSVLACFIPLDLGGGGLFKGNVPHHQLLDALVVG